VPDTLLGVVLFAASLGPGYVYVRIAETRNPRPSRSQLGEAIEMVVIGVVMSAAAAMVAIGIAQKIGLLDTEALVDDSVAYLVQHPFRGFGTFLFALILSYGAAAAASYVRFRKDPAVIRPGMTMWHAVFWSDRPSKKHEAIVTLELRTGGKVTGVLRGFTAEFEENREIALRAPLSYQPVGADKPEPLSDKFLLFREEDIAYSAGRYWP
jgi:hypothetical protein